VKARIWRSGSEQQRLAAIKDEEQRQAKTADLEAKLNAAEAEQRRLKEEVQRQSKAAADAEGKLKAAQAEQQQLKEEVQRQARLAADAEAKRKAAEERLAKFEQAALQVSSTGLFMIRANTEAFWTPTTQNVGRTVASRYACAEDCARETNCKIFTYNKSSGLCYRYVQADFKPNESYDSGVRIDQTK